MKFLFLQVDKNLNWTKDADNLITTLIGAYCAVNSMCHITSIDTVKFIWPIFTWLYNMINFGGVSTSNR
jgi:hypothetical protein